MRRSFAALLCGAAAGVSLMNNAGPAGAWPGQQCPIGGKSVSVSPGISTDALRQVFNDLSRGDTLLLRPGVFDVGRLNIYSCRATADHPITVRPLDPDNPPLIRGSMYFNSPDYWHIHGLRIEGTVRHSPSLHISGGTGWVVDGVEVFGARQTGSYANVVLGDRGGQGPAGFTLANSCIHGGAIGKGIGFHNIYVNARGMGSVSGLITRNVIFDNPRGGGIKLGAGGGAGTPGPWNVRVEANTIVGGAFGMVLHGRISRDVITRNLMGEFVRNVGASYRGAKRSAVYAHQVAGRGNLVEGNYFFDTDIVMRKSGSARVTVANSNAIGPAPVFDTRGCGGWRPSGRAASYGARA